MSCGAFLAAGWLMPPGKTMTRAPSPVSCRLAELAASHLTRTCCAASGQHAQHSQLRSALILHGQRQAEGHACLLAQGQMLLY